VTHSRAAGDIRTSKWKGKAEGCICEDTGGWTAFASVYAMGTRGISAPGFGHAWVKGRSRNRGMFSGETSHGKFVFEKNLEQARRAREKWLRTITGG